MDFHWMSKVKEYADKQGMMEQLKAKNQMEWVRKMNNIRACVREGVEKEKIYVNILTATSVIYRTQE